MFSQDAIQTLENQVIAQTDKKGKDVYKIKCLVRNKEIVLVLFDKARTKWEGVFPDSSKIELTYSHLAVCVRSLQDVKLFNSNLDVVDEAFEYLINKSAKGEKGQYFTPRYVIDMCVKMLNPRK